MEALKRWGPVTRKVGRAGNESIWDTLIGNELPPLPDGRARDPYWESGSHPDCVEHVWDTLGGTLPGDCRALARSHLVLAHPRTDRIFAMAYGTQYILWLPPAECSEAIEHGARTSTTWAGGSVTDLTVVAGPGWVFGNFYNREPDWLLAAYEAVGVVA